MMSSFVSLPAVRIPGDLKGSVSFLRYKEPAKREDLQRFRNGIDPTTTKRLQPVVKHKKQFKLSSLTHERPLKEAYRSE